MVLLDGAKHILCLSRSGSQDEQIRVFIKEMHDRGVRIIIQKCDISREDDVASVAEATARSGFPEIRGVIQCATVAKDAPFEAMKASDWRGSLAPKVTGTLNLHLAFGKELDFFVVMSSAVALHGSGGLSNYAAGCSFQVALVRQRVASGMPSFSINAGAIREVGFVSENPVAAAALQRHGLGTISILDPLAMLNYAVTQPDNRDPANCVLAVGLLPNRPQDSSLSARRFLYLQHHDSASLHTRSAENTADDAALLHDGLDRDEASAIILRAITKQLSKLTDIAVESINAAQPLQSYGVDSLVAVELRSWISVYLQADISLIALRGASSITELANLSTEVCRLIEKKC